LLFAIGNALSYGTDDIAGFADTDTDLTFFVADDNDGPEAHFLTAFDGLGDTADLHHALLPFGIALLSATSTATIAATSIAVTATTALFLLLLLASSCGRDIGRARHGI
tara:strand:- start:88 stop:414 length:327 start_codon:yes stop_codon:yes gene_type:complete